MDDSDNNTLSRRKFMKDAAKTAALGAAAASGPAATSHAQDEDHQHLPDDIALRVKALETVLVEKQMIDPADIDEQTVASTLYTAAWPDPDLLIRTSGEYRISNFLLWQLAYTELYTTPVLWPDFTREHLFEAVIDYQGRDRRFGKVPV